MKDHHMLQLMAHMYFAAAFVKSDAPMTVIFAVGFVFGLMSVIYVWRST